MPKNAEKFVCDYCDFICFKESNYNKHLTTRKHILLTNPNKKMPKKVENTVFFCSCGKEYKHASSLSFHKKKCIDKDLTNNILNNKNITGDINNITESIDNIHNNNDNDNINLVLLIKFM